MWYHYGMEARITTNVRLPRDLVQRLDRYAADKGISRNAAISILLDQALPKGEQA